MTRVPEPGADARRDLDPAAISDGDEVERVKGGRMIKRALAMGGARTGERGNRLDVMRAIKASFVHKTS